MGNNVAGALLEWFIIACENRGVLDKKLLKDFARAVKNVDWDTGGFADILSKDGLCVCEVVAKHLGKLPAERPKKPGPRSPARDLDAYEAYVEKMNEVFLDFFDE